MSITTHHPNYWPPRPAARRRPISRRRPREAAVAPQPPPGWYQPLPADSAIVRQMANLPTDFLRSLRKAGMLAPPEEAAFALLPAVQAELSSRSEAALLGPGGNPGDEDCDHWREADDFPIGMHGTTLNFAVLQLRRELGAAVEVAIAVLDAIDGDPDLEIQCEDEGAQCDGGGGEDACEDEGAQCEGEGDSEGCDDEDGGDKEPSLSSTMILDQRKWIRHPTGLNLNGEMSIDLEAQCEDEGYDSDREPDCDREPDDGEMAVRYVLLPDGTPDHTRPVLGY